METMMAPVFRTGYDKSGRRYVYALRYNTVEEVTRNDKEFAKETIGSQQLAGGGSRFFDGWFGGSDMPGGWPRS